MHSHIAQITLKSHHCRYLNITNGGELRGIERDIGTEEEFSIWAVDDTRCYIKSHHYQKFFLSAVEIPNMLFMKGGWYPGTSETFTDATIWRIEKVDFPGEPSRILLRHEQSQKYLGHLLDRKNLCMLDQACPDAGFFMERYNGQTQPSAGAVFWKNVATQAASQVPNLLKLL